MNKKKVIGIAIIILVMAVSGWAWLNTRAETRAETKAEGKPENITVKYSASFELIGAAGNLPIENAILVFPYPHLTVRPEKVKIIKDLEEIVPENEVENLFPPVIEGSITVLPKGIVKGFEHFENAFPERGWGIKPMQAGYARNIRLPELAMLVPKLGVGEKVEVKSEIILPENLSENLTLTNYYFENFPAEDPVPMFSINHMFGDNHAIGVSVTASFEVEIGGKVNTMENVSRTLKRKDVSKIIGWDYTGIILKK